MAVIVDIGQHGKRENGVKHSKFAILRAECGPILAYETSVLNGGEEIVVTRTGMYRGDASPSRSGNARQIAGLILPQHQDGVTQMLRKLGYVKDMHFLDAKPCASYS